MLIGLTGYAQHGKDTAGNYLVEKYDFVRLAFADALKEMAFVLDPYILFNDPDRVSLQRVSLRLSDLVELEGWEGAKTHNEVRRFLQVLGTEAVRNILGEDSWVRALDDDYRSSWLRGENVVITDVRFPNEAEYVLRSHGEVWAVERYNEDWTFYDNGIGTDHPSERYLKDLPVAEILMARNVDELHAAVDDKMKGKHVE